MVTKEERERVEYLKYIYDSVRSSKTEFQQEIAQAAFEAACLDSFEKMKAELKAAGYEVLHVGSYPDWYDSAMLVAEPKIRDKSGWPAIWAIVERYFGMAAGNGLSYADQAQAKISLPVCFRGRHVL